MPGTITPIKDLARSFQRLKIINAIAPDRSTIFGNVIHEAMQNPRQWDDLIQMLVDQREHGNLAGVIGERAFNLLKQYK